MRTLGLHGDFNAEQKRSDCARFAVNECRHDVVEKPIGIVRETDRLREWKAEQRIDVHKKNTEE